MKNQTRPRQITLKNVFVGLQEGPFWTLYYLIQRFSCYIDAVDLEDLVINSQKPCAFC